MSCHLPISMCFLILTAAAPPETDEHPIRPDAGIQARIDHAVHTVLSEADSPLKQLAAFETLREIHEDSAEQLLKQILYYCSNPANDHDRRLYAFLTIAHFRYPDSTTVRAVTPYIYTKHATLNRVVGTLLTGIEHWGGLGPTNYGTYESVVRANKDDPPANLVRYMYERSPGMAVLSMMYVYVQARAPRKPILWGEHVVSDVLWKQRYGFLDKNEVPDEAAAELGKLSKHEAWWTRLYVAEILRQHPQFRTAELIGRLKADEHELVRRAIQEAEQPRGQKKTSESNAEDSPP